MTVRDVVFEESRDADHMDSPADSRPLDHGGMVQATPLVVYTGIIRGLRTWQHRSDTRLVDLPVYRCILCVYRSVWPRKKSTVEPLVPAPYAARPKPIMFPNLSFIYARGCLYALRVS